MSVWFPHGSLRIVFACIMAASAIPAIDAGQAVRPFVEQLIRSNDSNDGPGERTLRKRAHDHLYKLPKTDTVHGVLLDTLEVQGSDGVLRCAMLNIFAFYSLAASMSKDFFLFMRKLIANATSGTLRFALYGDGVVPRNQQRPDKAGSFEAIRFTVLNSPQWMRSRAGLRWIPLMYPTHDKMEACGVTCTMLMASILEYIFEGSGWNMSTGILLRHGSEEPILLQMEFAAMHEDGAALKESFSLKGSSGCSPCGICSNVMGRCGFFEDDSGFSHVWSPEFHKCTFHTNATFFAMADEIEAAESVGKRKELEVIYGLNYEPEGLIFRKSLRKHIKMPHAIYVDHMHSWTASGGIAQHHINQFIRRFLVFLNMSVAALDKFANIEVKGIERCRKDFFKTRLVDADDAHFRGFATDCLKAISIMAILVDMILPAGVLTEEVACFLHLRLIITILRNANPAHIHRLLEETIAHHRKYIALYPDCVKPKLHACLHVAHSWSFHLALLSCYGAEADHRPTCRVYRFALSNPSKTSMAYAIQDLFTAVMKPETFIECYLVPPVRRCNQELDFGFAGKYVVTKTAKKLQTAIGILKTKAMLQCLISEGHVVVGEAVSFLKVDVRGFPERCDGRGFPERHLCLVRVFRKAPDGWWYDSKSHMFVDSSMVQAMVVYVQDESGRLFVDLVHV